MAEEATTRTASGVQDLITRLRDEGVQAGRSEADRIVSEARQEAAEIVARAEREAQELRERTRSELAREREAAMEALKLASRDTVLELRQGIARRFEQNVRRLVSQATVDPETVRSLILVLAGHAASEFVRDRQAEILFAQILGDAGQAPDPAAGDPAKALILGITNDMLREGIEVVPSDQVPGGVRARVKGEQVEIDLSDDAVTRLLARHLLPRFQSILSGAE